MPDYRDERNALLAAIDTFHQAVTPNRTYKQYRVAGMTEIVTRLTNKISALQAVLNARVLDKDWSAADKTKVQIDFAQELISQLNTFISEVEASPVPDTFDPNS